MSKENFKKNDYDFKRDKKNDDIWEGKDKSKKIIETRKEGGIIKNKWILTNVSKLKHHIQKVSYTISKINIREERVR